MSPIDPSQIRAFETPAEFGRWLEAHHAAEPLLWLKIYKKGSGRPTLQMVDAIREALCWGWIDGLKRSYDDEAYLQRFTPRKPKSNWSKRNRAHVESLIAAGKMREPGMVHVRAAQADGRWEQALAPPAAFEIPADFLAALEAHPEAGPFFESLSQGNRKEIARLLGTAKKPVTRQRRFDRLLGMLARGEKPT